VIIDEAGMADTLTLDAAVQFAIDRRASIRLVGDDQQLAAIGAGGVLRDITHTHGALHLAALHRFTNPAEAAASLASATATQRRSTSISIRIASTSAA
jgi:ATP-dependent exoDNAse (exonuclease V) alpha subunit